MIVLNVASSLLSRGEGRGSEWPAEQQERREGGTPERRKLPRRVREGSEKVAQGSSLQQQEGGGAHHAISESRNQVTCRAASRLIGTSGASAMRSMTEVRLSGMARSCVSERRRAATAENFSTSR